MADYCFARASYPQQAWCNSKATDQYLKIENLQQAYNNQVNGDNVV